MLIKSIVTITLGALLMLQGCGFHLRGGLQGENIPVTYLKEGRASALQEELRLVENITTENAAGAELVLNVISESFNRRVLSVGDSGKVREYEVSYKVSFAVFDKGGKELLTPQNISLRRDYRFDTTQVLGADSEETILRQDMVRDAAQQIVRRLQVLKSG